MRVLGAGLLVFALFGCAANSDFVEGRRILESGQEEEGLMRIEQAWREEPANAEIRNYYLRHRDIAVQRWLRLGDNARAAGAFERAEEAYARALRLDAQNARARAGFEQARRDRASLPAVREAQEALKRGDEAGAYAKARAVLAENPLQREARAMVRVIDDRRASAERMSPRLSAALQKAITIELRDAPVRSVFELISKRTGLNFVFDRDVSPELRTTLSVRDTPIEQVLRLVTVTNQLARRVLNENTMLIYPNTPQKAQAYRELMVRSFYLQNADAKQTANMVRLLVKTRDLFVDEKLNMLVMRDTPEAVRIVENLIAAHDLAEPEVELEVEVVEVGRTQLTQLGIQWPTTLEFSVIGAAGVPGQLTGREAQHLTRDDWRLRVSDPFLAFDFREALGRTNVLANPRIRVKNREKARIHIGDKVPVITTTAGATGFVSETVNYLDVGLKLEVEPQVYLNDDVGIKVGLEVSNIVSQSTSSSGTVAYQLGTRNAATTLRLRDGETQVLAGLINDEDRRAASGVPGLADLPVLGHLFASHDDTVNKTEVVLLITPRVVRNVQPPGASVEAFESGTELEVGGTGAPPSAVFVAPPAQTEPPAKPSAPLPPAAGPAPLPAPSAPTQPR